MELFNIIVRSDDDPNTYVLNAIPTKNLEFLPRLAGFEDTDFAIGQDGNKWCVWLVELGLLVVSASTKLEAKIRFENLMYDKGRVKYYKAFRKMQLLLEAKGFKLPINDPLVFSQLNYRFEYESN